MKINITVKFIVLGIVLISAVSVKLKSRFSMSDNYEFNRFAGSFSSNTEGKFYLTKIVIASIRIE